MSQRKYVAFDLEIAFLGPEVPETTVDDQFQPGLTPVPAVQQPDWRQFRPFGITCAALAWEERDRILTRPIFGKKDNQPAPQMTKEECQALVHHLRQIVDNGFTLLTWNGLGFDFDVLGEESGLVKECAQLAMQHVDMMFHFFCRQGYPLGLDKAAKGMGLEGKSHDVNGAAAPRLWQEGEYEKVLDYVQQDARATLQVARAVEYEEGLKWMARSGKLKYTRIPLWLTVEDALYNVRMPNNSWMDNPMTREQFSSWAIEALELAPVPS